MKNLHTQCISTVCLRNHKTINILRIQIIKTHKREYTHTKRIYKLLCAMCYRVRVCVCLCAYVCVVALPSYRCEHIKYVYALLCMASGIMSDKIQRETEIVIIASAIHRLRSVSAPRTHTHTTYAHTHAHTHKLAVACALLVRTIISGVYCQSLRDGAAYTLCT